MSGREGSIHRRAWSWAKQKLSGNDSAGLVAENTGALSQPSAGNAAVSQVSHGPSSMAPERGVRQNMRFEVSLDLAACCLGRGVGVQVTSEWDAKAVEPDQPFGRDQSY